MSWFKILRWLILFAIIGFAIYNIYPHLSDFAKLRDLKNSINYWWIFFGVMAQIGEYFADGWLSQTLLRIVSVKISLKHTFLVASLDVFAAHLLPVGDIGGLAAAYHFYRKMGVSAEKFFFLSLTWGILTRSILLILFLASTFFMPDLPIHIHTTAIGVTVILLIVAACLFAFLNRRYVLTRAAKILAKYDWSKELASFFANRRTYFALVVKHKNLMSQAFAAAFLYFACDIATLVFAFLAFHALPPIPIIVFAYACALTLGQLGLTPGGLGTAEAVLLIIFTNAAIDPPLAVAAILVFRLLSFWLCLPTGFFSYVALKRELAR